MLRDLNVQVDGPTIVNEDNKGAIIWGTDGVRNAKHVYIRYSYVKDLVERKLIKLVYCSSENMIVDILKKPLLRPLLRVRFGTHLNSLCAVQDTEQMHSNRSCKRRG